MRLFCWLWRYTARCCAQLTVVVTVNKFGPTNRGSAFCSVPALAWSTLAVWCFFAVFTEGLAAVDAANRYSCMELNARVLFTGLYVDFSVLCAICT